MITLSRKPFTIADKFGNVVTVNSYKKPGSPLNPKKNPAARRHDLTEAEYAAIKARSIPGKYPPEFKSMRAFRKRIKTLEAKH